IPPCRALSRRGPIACNGEGACAQALTESRRDYIARLPGGRKTPQQPAGGVEEVAPQWCGTQPKVKNRSTHSGAQRTTGGGGARCPRAARQPTTAPRLAHACAAWPRHAPCMRPRSASTDACLARPTALAGYQTAVVILLVIGPCFTWRVWNTVLFNGL